MPNENFVAWKVVPSRHQQQCLADKLVYFVRDEAVRAAQALDGDDFWMIQGLNQDEYERWIECFNRKLPTAEAVAEG